MDNQFTGNIKQKVPVLWHLEQKWIAKIVPLVPSYFNGYNLTLLAILWIVLVVVFGWLAGDNISWLWAVSVVIILHYITDSLDGAVGRYRNSGLVRWGYYLDHFLDYLFLCSIIIGYAFILTDYLHYLLILLVLLGAFMASTYLDFAATKRFTTGYFKIGATEMRVAAIILNILMIFFGTKFISIVLPYFLIFLFVVLCFVIYKMQKEIFQLDIIEKNKT